MKNKFYALAATLLLAAPFAQVQAQISEGGRPASYKNNAVKPYDQVPTVNMPAFDKEAMMAEDAINNEYKVGPWRFGNNFAVNLNLQNSGVWEELGNGDRIWRVSIASKNAIAMSIEFSEYNLPVGATVFMYSGDRSEVLGGWTNANMKPYGGLPTDLIGGGKIIVEYFEPAAVRGDGALTIGRVTHAYRDIMEYTDVLADEKGLGDSGSCNNNVICPVGDNWRCEIKSVVIITVNGNGACTGTMLNNVPEDGTPLFLTANHCLGNPSTWVYRFNWDSPSCNQNQNGPTNQTVSSGTLLASSAGSDVALVELSSVPPTNYDVYYTGWDASGATPTNQVAIHHPSGDVKKISFDDQAASQATFGGAQCWNISNWEDGTTEPGSSGSGLWDQNHRLIGQLYGGSASCSSISDDYYGRLDVSWNAGLSAHLDPGNTGTMVIDGRGTGACAGVAFADDAAIQAVNGVGDLCNADQVTPVAVLKNNGTNTMTTCEIIYTLNGSANTYNWSGSLAGGATENVTLPTLSVPAGNNTLIVASNLPNGQADANTANDASTTNFNVVTNGITVTVDIVLDQYGSETTWEIEDGTGNVVASGGPYVDGMDGTLESVDLCLQAGVCYDFIIYDGYGDGICCGFGQGSYTVSGDNGATVYATGGDFNDDETTNFCPTVGINEVGLLTGVALYPNPTSGLVTVDLSRVVSNKVDVRVYNLVGELVNAQTASGNQKIALDLRNNAEGMYFIEVVANGKRSVKKVTLTK